MSANSSASHLKIRMLCEGAMMVALAQVLSYIKLMELPNGGSLTPAMFPILLFAVRWGLAPGLMAGFTFGLLQLIFDGAYAWGWQSMLLDYLVAFTPLGLAGPVSYTHLIHFLRRHYPDQVKGQRAVIALHLSRISHPAPLCSVVCGQAEL